VLTGEHALPAFEPCLLPLQDTPGWGDDVNTMRYLRVMAAYILEQQAKDVDKVAAGRILGKDAVCGQLQHTVTACLYFIPPHRLKRVDLILLAALSKIVAVIRSSPRQIA